MDTFSRDDLRRLLANRQMPCVSILMPTSRGAGQEDKIRWKNQVRAAEKKLLAQGYPASDAKTLLKRATELREDVPFWQDVSLGLAAFLSPEQSHFYRLPLAFNEQAAVADHFQIKPLLPLLSEDGRFFVLTLSKKNVRLLQGSRQRIDEIQLHDIPANLVEALQYNDEIRSRTVHTHTAAGGAAGRREAIFHGHGPGVDSAKDGILEFFQMVDRGLQQRLHNEHAPLVLAAADYLLPIYRQASTYPHVLEEAIVGHPDRLSAAELHDRAWDIVQPHFHAERDKISALYRQLAGTGRTAKEVAEIVRAAYQGQLQYLFVVRSGEQWGKFDSNNQQVHLHDKPEPGDEDLLNLAAIHTLAHKGKVFEVEPAEMPDRTPLAGIFWLPAGERTSQRVL